MHILINTLLFLLEGTSFTSTFVREAKYTYDTFQVPEVALIASTVGSIETNI